MSELLDGFRFQMPCGTSDAIAIGISGELCFDAVPAGADGVLCAVPVESGVALAVFPIGAESGIGGIEVSAVARGALVADAVGGGVVLVGVVGVGEVLLVVMFLPVGVLDGRIDLLGTGLARDAAGDAADDGTGGSADRTGDCANRASCGCTGCGADADTDGMAAGFVSDRVFIAGILDRLFIRFHKI